MLAIIHFRLRDGHKGVKRFMNARRQANKQVPIDMGLRISQAERKTWVSIALVRAGAMFSAPTLMVGAALGIGMALSGAALAVLCGYGFVVLYMSFIAMQASDLGLPTAILTVPSLGKAGARYLVALIVGIVTIGWFGVQTAVCGSSLSFMLNDVFGISLAPQICSVLLGILMLVTAVIGFDGLKWISTIAAPLLMAVCIYGVGYALLSSGSTEVLFGYVAPAQDAIGFIAGVHMAIGLYAFAGCTAGDFARFAPTRKAAVLSTVLGVLPAGFIALMAAAALAIVTGIDDVAVLMNSIGLPLVGLIALVLSAWTVNAGNVYSAGLGFAVMLGQDESGSKLTTLVSGIVGIVLAVVGILDQFQTWLSVLSAIAPAMAGVMIADYWMIRKANPNNFQACEGVSLVGVAALVAGMLCALLTSGTFAVITGLAWLDFSFFIAPVNGLVIAIVVYVMAYKLSGQMSYLGSVCIKTPEQTECER